jgi:predicted negative regulator of RcsB-dependent stress response
MAKKKETFAENSEQMFEETVSRIEGWFLKNQKHITTAVLAVVILVGGYFGYKFLYLEPREKAAQEDLFFAQNYFEIDSLNWALNGDGINYGMLDVIDNYKGTKAANLAHYYTGIIYLKKGLFEEAISYLKKFKSNELILTPLVRSSIGDCYAELGDMQEALSHYEKAASSHKNDMVTPMVLMKAAVLCNLQNDYQKALMFYTRIRDEHVRSNEARDIDKHIAMMEAKINQ